MPSEDDFDKAPVFDSPKTPEQDFMDRLEAACNERDCGLSRDIMLGILEQFVEEFGRVNRLLHSIFGDKH